MTRRKTMKGKGLRGKRPHPNPKPQVPAPRRTGSLLPFSMCAPRRRVAVTRSSSFDSSANSESARASPGMNRIGAYRWPTDMFGSSTDRYPGRTRRSGGPECGTPAVAPLQRPKTQGSRGMIVTGSFRCIQATNQGTATPAFPALAENTGVESAQSHPPTQPRTCSSCRERRRARRWIDPRGRPAARYGREAAG